MTSSARDDIGRRRTGGLVTRSTGLASGLALAMLLASPRVARAHRDDYIDETFVYQTLGGREAELELWGESRVDRSDRSHAWTTGAFEYGITPRWTLDGAAQTLFRNGTGRFGRLRFETRYRFAEEGERILDTAVSAEYEHETSAATGGDPENLLTPRLVLSKDLVPDLNTTLNLDVPIALTGPGDVSFAYALALRYPAETTVRFGVEMKHAPSEHTATAFPQVWFALPREMTIKVGGGIGLTDRADRFVGRLVLEAEL